MSLPKHIAIIMDGNRRWAKKRNLPDIMGHAAGVKSVDIITEECASKGIEALTLYGFSSENWTRPGKAVEALFKLIKKSLEDYFDKINKNNVKLNLIGRIDDIPEFARGTLVDGVKKTSSNTGLILTLALNYGSRQEIIDAAKGLCSEVVREKRDVSSIREEDLEEFLYTKGLPELDLVIRTSGEERLSNFLLWQAAYAELYFTPVLWPDFGKEEFEEALSEYADRQRRFGG